MDCFVAVSIKLIGLADIPLTFNLTTTSGIAVAGQDFIRVSEIPFTINPGTMSSEVNIQLVNANYTDAESFAILLKPGEGLPHRVNLDSNTTTIYIKGNDSLHSDVL